MPSAASTFPRRGAIYLASLDKDRPDLILSVDSLNRYALNVCVVPITSVQRSQFSMRVPLAKGESGLNINCRAKCDQLTTLEKSFLHAKPFDTLPPAELQQIENQVKLALGHQLTILRSITFEFGKALWGAFFSEVNGC